MTRLVTLATWLNPVPRAALALSCGLMAWHGTSMADPADPFSLKMSEAVSPDRFFIRAGVIGVKIKSKSGETYDVTGPALTKAQLETVVDPADTSIRDVLLNSGVTINGNPLTSVSGATSLANFAKGSLGIGALVTAMTNNGIDQIGTPKGIGAVAAKSAGTAGLSLGYYLDDEYKWAVEAYVLAAPVSTYVNATGQSTTRQDPDTGEISQRPFGIEGQKILTTKLLPPTVILGRYWGDKTSKFRPYTGLVAMYAIFYDVKATDTLNSFVGGSNPGDTTASFKNTFGLGPMLGLKYQISDKWHLSLNVGHVKLKTQGTIVTRNSLFTDTTGAAQELGPLSDAIQVGINQYGVNGVGGGLANISTQNPQLGGLSGLVTRAIALSEGKSDLGTFVRKADATLTNTLFMLSVGHSF